MAKYTRRLALTVEQTDPNEFLWVIREGNIDSEDFPFEVAAATEPADTYRGALRAGFDALDTMAQENPERGPQVEIAPPAPVEGETIPSRTEIYKDRLIEGFCRKLSNGCYLPAIRVHANPKVESAWESSPVPFPRGGFVELQEAFEMAIEAGQLLIDGKPYADHYQLEEGGPASPAPMRDLLLRISENDALEYSWSIVEEQEDGEALERAFSCYSFSNYQAALKDGATTLLLMSADPAAGPRLGDLPPKERCPGAFFVPVVP